MPEKVRASEWLLAANLVWKKIPCPAGCARISDPRRERFTCPPPCLAWKRPAVMDHIQWSFNIAFGRPGENREPCKGCSYTLKCMTGVLPLKDGTGPRTLAETQDRPALLVLVCLECGHVAVTPEWAF